MKKGEQEIICVASNPWNIDPTILIRISPDNTVNQLSAEGLHWGMSDIWFRNSKRYLVVGYGFYSKPEVTSNELWVTEISSPLNRYYTNAIDGENYSDIIISGDYSELIHYNGYSWKNLSNEVNTGNWVFIECKMKNGMVIIIGNDGQNSIVIKGKR